MRRLWTIALVLLALTHVAAAADEFMASGDDKAMWLLRRDAQNDTFDLAVRATGGSWKLVATDLTGAARAIAVSDGDLHVLFLQGDYRIYSHFAPGVASDPAKGTPGPQIKGVVLAACSGEGLSKTATQPAFIAFTQGSPSVRPVPGTASSAILSTATTSTSSPSTFPASAPSMWRLPGLEVEIIPWQMIQGEWKPLPALGNVHLQSDTRVLPLVHAGKLYIILAAAPGGVNRWACLETDRWRELPLSKDLQRAKILAMITVGQNLTLLVDHPAGEGEIGSRSTQPATSAAAGPRQLELVNWSESVDDFVYQPVTQQGQPMSFDAPGVQAACRVGSQAILLWKKGQELWLTSCSPQGQVISSDTISIFDRSEAGRNAQEFVNYFMVGVVVAIFLLLFLTRPTQMPRPFTLPSSVVPGSLLKRALALAIDFIPLGMIVMAFVEQPKTDAHDLEGVLKEVQRMMTEQSTIDEALIWFYVSLSLYVLYCAIMEWKFSATLGKMAMRLRVVGDGGRRPTLREAALRNLLKFVEMIPLPVIQIPPLLFMPFLVRTRQRLGDMVARTIVLDARSLPEGPMPPLPPGPEDSPPPEG